MHGVGRAGAPETGADTPAAKVAVTGSVAFVGMPKVMLSRGGIPVPVAAGTTVTPVPVGGGAPGVGGPWEAPEEWEAVVCCRLLMATCLGFTAWTLDAPSKAIRAVRA